MKLHVTSLLIIGLVAGAVGFTQSTASAASIGSLPAKCQTKSKTICIVKGEGAQARLYAIKNKQIVAERSARTGDTRELSDHTREGTFQVAWKSADWVSTIYNSPMPYSMFFSGGQAIHYSYDFAAVGYNGASHGCVNLRDYEFAKWLYSWSPVGTRVVVTK